MWPTDLLAPAAERAWGHFPWRWLATAPLWARVIVIPLLMVVGVAGGLIVLSVAIGLWMLVLMPLGQV